MEGLIVVIVFAVIIYRTVKASKVTMVSSENQNRSQQQNAAQPRTQQQNVYVPQSSPVSVQSTQQKDLSVSQSIAARREMQEKKTEMHSKADKVPMEKGKTQSTTDYLKQKAAMDEIGHQQEVTRQRVKQESFEPGNGAITAERLIMGDSVPRDRQIVKCGYCGAENLVPHSVRSKYACYFCREVL